MSAQSLEETDVYASVVTIPLSFRVASDPGGLIADSLYAEWMVEKANRWLLGAGVCVRIAEFVPDRVPGDFENVASRFAGVGAAIPVAVGRDLMRNGEPKSGVARTAQNWAVIAINRKRAGDRTLAHELGHVLGLDHNQGSRHVMHSPSPNMYRVTPLTASERATVRREAVLRRRRMGSPAGRCERFDLPGLDEIGSGHRLLHRTERSSLSSVYYGETLFGLAHGSGSTWWNAGSLHDGEYRFGQRHGPGVHASSDGGRYVGEFRQGRRQGEGRYAYPSGDVYVGGFDGGRRHGRGVYWFRDGTRREGEYRHGSRLSVGRP